MKSHACFLVVIPLLIKMSRAQQLENLVFKKPASQSSNFHSLNGAADSAVDGYDNYYSRTQHISNQWWRVDMGTNYTIGEIKIDFSYASTNQRSRTSILTSLHSNPPDPTLLSDDRTRRVFNSPWTEQSYQEAAYEALAVVSLQNVVARHLTVFNSGSYGLILNEVYVYQMVCWNIALRKPSNQSLGNTAYYGNDDIMPVSHNPDQMVITGELSLQWWKVDLGSASFVYKVIIYGRVDCCQERYTGWSVLTSILNSDPIVNGRLNDGWTSQVYIAGQVNNKSEIILTPAVSARCVAVSNPVGNLWGIVLRELQVYGCHCVLQEALDRLKVMTSIQPGCITVFQSWSPILCYNAPFTFEYLCGGEQTWTSHTKNFSDSVCFSAPGTTATCQLRACVDNVCVYKQAVTGRLNCTKPSEPTEYSLLKKKLNTGFVEITLSWKASLSGCYGNVVYNVILQGPDDSRSFQLSETSKTIDRILPCTNYSIIVTAINNQMMSASSTLRISLIDETPLQNIQLSALNSTCVQVQWELQTLPDLCSSKTLTVYCNQSSSNKSNPYQVLVNTPADEEQWIICGFQASSHVFCNLQAINSSKAFTVEAYTADALNEEALTTKPLPAKIFTTHESWVLPVAAVSPVSVVTIIAAIVFLVLKRRRKMTPSESGMQTQTQTDEPEPYGAQQVGYENAVELQEEMELKTTNPGCNEEYYEPMDGK